MKVVNLPAMPSRTRMVEHLWDLIEWNEESLVEDYARLKPQAEKPAGPYHMMDDENVWIGEGVDLQPGVVLDGSKGPVVIEKGCGIGANSVLQGPCFIGSYVQVLPLTLIRPGASIGPMCKVGGTIANSIMFGYSNKVHEGFVGDSYIGKWVNLGAGTTTSNLKNTYGPISVHIADSRVETGRRFLAP